ncbi:hypothetical protein PC117_g21021 [Phytophthora cactorum]|uniref:Uncharacterized protein n=1 Tax=Phytophthora cactorum TaxID=29920 RepID=A0A8T1BLI3_9STRA|nr:hypothetical protein PC117_g21021 [Phytophthora cactorum]
MSFSSSCSLEAALSAVSDSKSVSAPSESGSKLSSSLLPSSSLAADSLDDGTKRASSLESLLLSSDSSTTGFAATTASASVVAEPEATGHSGSEARARLRRAGGSGGGVTWSHLRHGIF